MKTSPETYRVSRRTILQKSLQMMALAGVGAGRPTFAAEGGSIDRALVCVFLMGGNDSNNMVVPLSQYSSYAGARGALAISPSALLQVNDTVTREAYGFHPALTAIEGLFNSGQAAIVANAGYAAASAPDVAFRHADPGLAYFEGGYFMPAWASNYAGASPQSTGTVIGGSSGASLILSAAAALARSGTEEAAAFRRVTSSSAAFPSSAVGQQLRRVAAALAAPAAGISRPIFLVRMSGYATTWNQAARQSLLYQDLNLALGAFQQALSESGLSQRVTTYLDTECNRTLKPNASGGTGPAWGGHHIVIGGAVLGGRVYGTFPSLSLGSPDDADGAGTWRPTTSKDQFDATLANWYGIPYSDLATWLPGVASLSQPVMNFMTG